jgi:antitoxin component HigA of HigAB toxin-antitoxin module
LRLKEAQEIGKHLSDQPDLATQIKNIVDRMKQVGSLKLQDETGLERLSSSVIEGFRELEIELSKSLQQQFTKENLHLAKDEDIPEPYRKQVEDYYKALSKK